MIEIIYNKENEKKDEYLRLPKNIRQIGIPDELKKVYIEDYAITFINQFASKNTEEAKVAILVGYSIYNNSCEYIFVSGVIDADEVKINKDSIEFPEKAWTGIYDKMKKFFPGQDIVGWFLTAQGFHSESSDHIIKAHIDNFAGNDKLFMKIDQLENEEIFYVFQNSHFVRQMGYYIYYEKNEEMQEYMVQTKELVQEEQPIEKVEDYAAKSFRTIIQEKKDEKHQKKILTFMYSTSMFLGMIVIVIGITMMNNYDKMRSMEQTLNSISQVVNGENEKIASDWFANNEENIASETDVATNETANADTANVDTSTTSGSTGNDQTATEALNQTAIPVENVAGDVQKQETTETTETTETAETQTTQDTSGTVTEISSTEEELQNTLESSAGEQVADDSGAAQTTEATAETVTAEPQYYTIEKGDTLATISMKFYGTKDMVEKICELNNIENDNKIQAGQQIQLP